MIRALLWDLDGVIVDTTDLHFWSWVTSLSRRGRELDYAQFMTTFGMNNRATLAKLYGPLSENEITSITELKEILFRQEIPGRVQVYPGVLDWLAQAKQAGIPCAVASSAPPENIQALIGQFHLESFFQAFVSSNGLPSKPDPAVFLRAAGELGIPPADCLVVEDAPAGGNAARTAGMHCVIVLTTRTQPEFPKMDLFLNRLSDLPLQDVLNKINQADDKSLVDG